MRVIRSVQRCAGLPGGCVLTIGNFDGLHLGHQAIIARLRERARALQLPSVVMTFEPMPRAFFDPDGAPARLSSLREKLEDARALGVDIVACARFDAEFAAMSAATYKANSTEDIATQTGGKCGSDVHGVAFPPSNSEFVAHALQKMD